MRMPGRAAAHSQKTAPSGEAITQETMATRRPPKAPARGRTKAAGVRKRNTAPARAERRAALLAAARDVFAKRGYHQATIDDIVAKAGASRGTFYLYFEDKRAVFAALMDMFWTRVNDTIIRIVPGSGEKPVERQILDNLRAVLKVCLKERAMTKILFSDSLGIDPKFDRKLMSFYDEVVQLITESLAEGQTLGIVREGEARPMAFLAVGAFKELLYQSVTMGLREESAAVLADQIFGFLRHGLLELR